MEQLGARSFFWLTSAPMWQIWYFCSGGFPVDRSYSGAKRTLKEIWNVERPSFQKLLSAIKSELVHENRHIKVQRARALHFALSCQVLSIWLGW